MAVDAGMAIYQLNQIAEAFVSVMQYVPSGQLQLPVKKTTWHLQSCSGIRIGIYGEQRWHFRQGQGSKVILALGTYVLTHCGEISIFLGRYLPTRDLHVLSWILTELSSAWIRLHDKE